MQASTQFNLLLILIFLTISGYSQENISNERLGTTTKVYGIIKYYNNEKDDTYLDKYLLQILNKIADTNYEKTIFNADIQNLILFGQPKLNSNLATDSNPFIRFKETDHVNTIDFSWIAQNKLLSEGNKKLLQKLINSHENISNSNIKKKQIYIHYENDEQSETSFNNLYLLGIIKFWNVIEFFFPYKSLMDEDWDIVLDHATTEILSIQTDEDYLKVLQKLSAKLNDSHVDVEDERINEFDVSKLPFLLNAVYDKLVITSINDSLSNLYRIRTGDIIESFDGRSYQELWDEFSELTSYSSPQAGKDYFTNYLWHRFNYNDSIVHTTIKSSIGVHSESVATIKLRDYRKFIPYEESDGSFRSINNQIGYIDYTDLSYSDLGKAIKQLRHKEYLILDCRGYNYGFSSVRLLNFLGNRKTPILKYYRTNLNYPGVFDNPKDVRLRILPKLKSTYKGKLIVLINEKALSAMESVLMAIEIRRPDAIFIGSPTQGCNGYKSLIHLPGGRNVWFTGGGDLRYPDGSQFQRIGIQPDILVEPDINSIINNEEIVLNHAIEYVLGK